MKKVMMMILAAAMMCSLLACGSAPAAKEVDLQKLYEECTGSMTEMMALDQDMLLDFLGIDPEDCEEIYAAIAMDGMLADEIWLVKARDGAAFQRIAQLAEGRIEAKKEETRNYAPEQFEIVSQAVILKEEPYLLLIVSPEAETVRAAAQAALQ